MQTRTRRIYVDDNKNKIYVFRSLETLQSILECRKKIGQIATARQMAENHNVAFSGEFRVMQVRKMPRVPFFRECRTPFPDTSGILVLKSSISEQKMVIAPV